MSRTLDFDTVILAGGGSSRMGGADKPGLAVGGTPMLVSVARAAAEAGASRLIVVGPARAGPVADGLGALARGRPGWLISVLEEPAASGPVAGLRRGLAEVGALRLLLLAADLPFLTPTDLRALLDAGGPAGQAAELPADPSARSASAGVVAADTSGTPQWLVSCWRRDSLRAALADYAGASLHGLLEPLNPVRIELGTSGCAAAPWFDCDTPDDLAAARQASLAHARSERLTQ